MSISVDLSGKVAIVTGSGRGIGRAVALALGKNGAAVVTAARTKEQIEAVSREIIQSGGKSLAVACDLADESQIQRLFMQLHNRELYTVGRGALYAETRE